MPVPSEAASLLEHVLSQLPGLLGLALHFLGNPVLARMLSTCWPPRAYSALAISVTLWSHTPPCLAHTLSDCHPLTLPARAYCPMLHLVFSPTSLPPARSHRSVPPK